MSGRALEIIRPGAQSIVVDRGRFGHRSIGVPWCGPMDAPALQRALAASLERADTAAIEIAYGNLECRFPQATRGALAGADCDASLDGAPLGCEGAFEANPGSVLVLRSPRRGSRTILAVHGGFAVAPCLGSRTTDLAAGLGGFEGRALRSGDRLPIAEARPQAPLEHGEREIQNDSETSVRVIRTNEHAAFTTQSQAAFWTTAWKLTHEHNRAGYRLEGATLRYDDLLVRPHAVFPGVIQVPSGGNPIVLMSDAQTTGGYPKIGVVVEEDLWRVAQLRTGECLRFVEVPR